jgi:IS30 family transposase
MTGNKKKHLSFDERFCIEKMCKAGESFSKIGRTLGRGLSTISEEVNRNGGREAYDARKAEMKAYFRQYRKKRGCNKVATDGPLTREVEKKLAQGQSPETIALRLKEEKRFEYASPKSIRKFVAKRPSLERFLFWNRHNRKSGPKRKDFALRDPERKFIDVRPLGALYEYGHFEGDFIVSKHNSSVLLVLVERHTKTLRLSLLPSRENGLVNKAISASLRDLEVRSLTIDNDIAFSRWRDLEMLLGANVYFCHPYHSWEKGLVENTNRWIRQFVPKKANLALLSEEDVESIERWFNHTPRQCLDGKTPYEMMMVEEFKKEVRSLEVNLPALRIWG